MEFIQILEPEINRRIAGLVVTAAAPEIPETVEEDDDYDNSDLELKL